jgi:hypothetical protein
LDSAHKHPNVKDLFPARNRANINYAPVYASRLHQVEHWFALLAQQMIGSADQI